GHFERTVQHRSPPDVPGSPNLFGGSPSGAGIILGRAHADSGGSGIDLPHPRRRKLLARELGRLYGILLQSQIPPDPRTLLSRSPACFEPRTCALYILILLLRGKIYSVSDCALAIRCLYARSSKHTPF